MKKEGYLLCHTSLERGARLGSLSCRTCYDTRPRFTQVDPKDRPVKSPLSKSQRHC